jgi:DNA-directed RNA polymerase I, II, and III subunit RPABC2
MSYFDENYGGGDASDENKSNGSDSEKETESDEEDNISETDLAEGGIEDGEDEDEDEEDSKVVAKGMDRYADSDDDYPRQQEDVEENKDEDADENSEDEDLEDDQKKKVKKIPTQKKILVEIDDDEDDEDPTGEAYLQKFDKEINDNYIVNCHPESAIHNYDEILAMTKVTRDKSGIIIDELHKTIPYLTKYEKARILGQRAKQINSGASVFVKVPEKVIDGYLIAELELKEKRVPFIIRRPLPNGGSEYWSIKDLENISF